jgi:Zn-dependent M28 family amino/carboxypeptidase
MPAGWRTSSKPPLDGGDRDPAGQQVRFAFWGAEEDILDGSQHYIGELSASETRQTALKLNADMIASPNGVDPFTTAMARIFSA